MAATNPYDLDPASSDGYFSRLQAKADAVGVSLQPSPTYGPGEGLANKVVGQIVSGQVDPSVITGLTPSKVEENPTVGKFVGNVGKGIVNSLYAIPVGLASMVTGAVQNPFKEAAAVVGSLPEQAKNLVSPKAWYEQPVSNAINVASIVMPAGEWARGNIISKVSESVSGIAKSTAADIASSATAGTDVSALEASRINSALNPKAIKASVDASFKAGDASRVGETVKANLIKSGVDPQHAVIIGNKVVDSVGSAIQQEMSRYKAYSAVANPVGAGLKAVGESVVDPIAKAIFGEPAKSAVGQLYGADVVSKNPQGFMKIEQWAQAQVRERGLSDTVANRVKMMNDWADQNTQWASLNPEQRIAHFENFVDRYQSVKQIHDLTGMDVVLTRALPQNVISSMVETLQKSGLTDVKEIGKFMESHFKEDWSLNSAEIQNAIASNPTKEGIIDAVSKMGAARSAVDFTRFSPAVRQLASELDGTGYRISYAPKEKPISSPLDIFSGSDNKTNPAISFDDLAAKRTAIGNWIDRWGLSSQGTPLGAVQVAFKENFMQRVLSTLKEKYGDILKFPNEKISLPIEKLYDWLDDHRDNFFEARAKDSGIAKQILPVRDVFGLTKNDLLKLGIPEQMAKDIVEISRDSLRSVPKSVTGLGDSMINYFRTIDNNFGRAYDNYIRFAEKGRYDWSPMFGIQQFGETVFNSSLMLKDPSMIGKALADTPGFRSLGKLGTWTVEKIAKVIDRNGPWVRDMIRKPTLAEENIVRDVFFKDMQKTFMDSTSIDAMRVEREGGFGASSDIKSQGNFAQTVQSKNIAWRAAGWTMNKVGFNFLDAFYKKFGMSLEEASAYTLENGRPVFKYPNLVSDGISSVQEMLRYKQGFLTSPMMKTLNLVWFPLRFQAKTMQIAGEWLNSLSPASKMIVMNNWAHFSNYCATPEGIKWRLTNKNLFYRVFNYATAYGQMGDTLNAVFKGRLFGGNAGMIGGVPAGFVFNIMRELALIPSDSDQINPKTGQRYELNTPKKLISEATVQVATEDFLISMMPSLPLYTISGGAISGVSTSGNVSNFVGKTLDYVFGNQKTSDKLSSQYKKVPLGATRYDNFKKPKP